MTVNVWRLQTRTASEDKIAQYCYDNNIVAMGWSITLKTLKEDLKLPIDICTEILNKKRNIKDYQHFRNIIETYAIYPKNKSGKINTDSVARLAEQFKKDDLVWMRIGGIYYIGRYTETSKYIFNSNTPEKYDSANQVTNIDWHEVGDETQVPGAVSIALIKGSTFQRITKAGITAVSQLIYNQKVNREHYNGIVFDNTMDNFFTLISPTGCEDLLSMYLFSQLDNKRYICIPSTSKISTELYECVFLNPDTGETAYIQSKEYNDPKAVIDADKYAHLSGEIYFFLHKAQPKNIENYPNMHIVDSKTLYDFATNPASRNTLPKNILHWIDFMKQYARP